MRNVLITALLAAHCAAAQQTALDKFTRPEIIELNGKVFHVQGIDLDSRHLWVTSVDSSTRKGYLHEFSLASGRLTRSVEVQDGDRFHPGGIAAGASSLWVPVAEYKRSSSAVIQKRSKATLELEAQFEVADHIGCVAVNDSVIVGGNWDSRHFYVWDHAGKLQRKVPNPTGTSFQDLKFHNGKLVGGGTRADHTGAIDWLDFPSLTLRHRLTAGKTHRGLSFTREGMALRNNRLYLLPEDGPTRLYIFRLPAMN